VLHSKSQFCGAATRALLLSTYIKWVNVFPEIKTRLISVFERYQKVLDSELQQRACEYLALAMRPEEDEMLQNVCEEMPVFPPRESALLGRLSRKHGDTEDKRVWVHGGKEVNKDRIALLDKQDTLGTQAKRIPRTVSGHDLDLLDFGALGLQSETHKSKQNEPIVPLVVGPHIDKWFERLCWSNEGVLYEDSQLQVGIKSEFHGHLGRIAVFMGNKITTPLTSFTTSVTSDADLISITFEKIPSNSVDPRSQSQQILQLECRKPFLVVPQITISFLAGSHQTIAMQLPVPLTKFFLAAHLNQMEFFERWRVIGGPPRETQDIFSISMDSSGEFNSSFYRKAISGSGFGLSGGIDPNPSNLVAAGILHTSQEGKVGCLLRFEPNKESKVSLAVASLTCF
jgi:AP-2 complex subunit alpha